MAQRDSGVQVSHGQEEYTSAVVRTVKPTSVLQRELVAHFRQTCTQLREAWARHITEARLLTALIIDVIFAGATSVYDNYLEALETENFEARQAYARNLSERISPRIVETHEVVVIVLLARLLFAKYRSDFTQLNRILDAHEPAADPMHLRTALHASLYT